MANVRSGNTHYVDSTGSLTSANNVKVAQIVITATAANAVVVIQDHAAGTKKLDLRVATSGATQTFDFSSNSIVFPNGINVTTLTNAIVMVVYTTGGG